MGSTPSYRPMVLTALLVACQVQNDIKSEDAEDENQPPELVSVTISPGLPYTADVLQAVVESFDADGDEVELRYNWYVNELASGEQESLDGAVSFDKHDVVWVLVTPFDGQVEGPPVSSSSVTVSNSPPTAPSLEITPGEPRAEADALICAATAAATDADADVLTNRYVWTVDGVTFDGASTTTVENDTVSAAYTAEGEVWTCGAAAWDGEVEGEPAETSVTVQACPRGDTVTCPARSCTELLSMEHGGTGPYWLDPDGDGLDATEVWCDLDVRDDGANIDAGGWTLVMVSSDDGVETWTWNNRHVWDTDSSTFGALDALQQDFKSATLHTLPFTDILAIHSPSGVWAVYNGVGDGTYSLADLITAIGDSACYAGDDGYALSAGTLATTTDCSLLTGKASCLCDTDLYVNPLDADGRDFCETGHSYNNATWGLAWSGRANDGCPLDDPGQQSGLGPSLSEGNTDYPSWADYEYYTPTSATDREVGIGFGAALELNTGAHGSAENHMQIYVR